MRQAESGGQPLRFVFMSIHNNPDGSITEGMKIEPNGTFVAHEIAVTCTASSQLANVAANTTKGAVQVVIQADGQDVRYRLDGTNPTAANGVLLKNGTSVALSMADALALKFIQVSATALVNATYTM